MMKILFVCTGNTCRSPLAETLLKEKLPDAEVQSAGLFAAYGQPASRGAIEVLKQRGLTLNHLSQPVSESLLQWADLVLVMTTQHKQSLALQFPAHQTKLFTLKEYIMKESEDDNWEELKAAYSDFEEKRADFLRKNEKNLSPLELEDAFYRYFKEEIDRINRLESSQPCLNISDPFGGDVQAYQATLQELETYIDLLVKKIKSLS